MNEAEKIVADLEVKHDVFDYQELCQRTKSDKFYGDYIPLNDLKILLEDSVDILNRLDKIKKALFYGKQPAWYVKDDGSLGIKSDDLLKHLTVNTGSKQRAIDIIHSILGMATESGEALELLLKVCNGEPFDSVNFKEEMFDSQWYQAIGCSAIGISFEEGQRNNIAKLKARFPEKFSEIKANERNLEAERAVLEDQTNERKFTYNLINENKLRSTDQADVWAEEFAKLHPEIDKGLMISWFANCAENAKDLYIASNKTSNNTETL